jgi:hypoxanthine-DNA glycosylase
MNQGRALWAEENYFEINSPTNSMIGPKEMSKESHSVSFSPILSDSPKILILGTIPGKESLKKKQYYSNSRNSFWKILFELLKVEKSLGCSYEEKIEILKQNNISLFGIFVILVSENLLWIQTSKKRFQMIFHNFYQTIQLLKLLHLMDRNRRNYTRNITRTIRMLNISHFIPPVLQTQFTHLKRN